MTDRQYAQQIEWHQSHIWQQLAALRTPSAFTLELTVRCPLNCRHCYCNLPVGDVVAAARELTLGEIDRIADQAAEQGVLWCLLTGGEPLLRPDFPDIYRKLKQKGFLVSIFTNATLITPAHVALWRQYPPRAIEVTAYGMTAAVYERVTRRPGSFTAFLRGLALLNEANLPVTLKVMMLRSNREEFPAILNWCRQFSQAPVRIDPHLHLRIDDDAARNADIRAERLIPADVVACECAVPERLLAWQHRCDHLPDPVSAPFKPFLQCGAGVRAFYVTYDGRFQLCGSLHLHNMTYDLRQGTLAEALVQFVPTLRAQQIDACCHHCTLQHLCQACPAYAILEAGDSSTPPDYFCAIARQRAETVGAILTRERVRDAK